MLLCPHDALAEDDVAVERRLARLHDGVGVFRALDKRVVLHHVKLSAGHVQIGGLTEGLPDGRLIAGEHAGRHLHHGHGLFHKVVQRKQRDDGAHHLGAAVTVAAHAALADRRTGEVAVGEHELVAVAHFGDDLKQFGADDRRDSLEHMRSSLSFWLQRVPFVRRAASACIIPRAASGRQS